MRLIGLAERTFEAMCKRVQARVAFGKPLAGQGTIRPFYLTLFGSHVILAAVIVPLVLTTVFFALRGNFIRHPRIARWTLPLWLYVSVSGVVIYLLGFHLYPPQA